MLATLPQVRPAPPDEQRIQSALLRTVAYSDLFDYPLTSSELHRYLIAAPISRVELETILAKKEIAQGRIVRRGDYFALADRTEIISIRERRSRIAARLWPQAIRYGRMIGSLPFIRMVSITGSLAVDNVEDGADLDYLIVTKVGRLWLSRAMIILVVRFADTQGYRVCPNYLLSEKSLALNDRDLYAAHELAQMVPLMGADIYQSMWIQNPWVAGYLPNAVSASRRGQLKDPGSKPIKKISEAVLGAAPVNRLEQWEMRRKIQRFSSRMQGNTEASFSADWCKGHFDQHHQRTMHLLEQQMQSLETEISRHARHD